MVLAGNKLGTGGQIEEVKNKKNIITFVGKLNRAKGYDIFAKAIINVLNKNRNWHSLVIGDERREKIGLNHKRVKILGFLAAKSAVTAIRESNVSGFNMGLASISFSFT